MEELISRQDALRLMWEALFAVEDNLEQDCAGTENNDDWFLIWRPWLQRGHSLCIDAVVNMPEWKPKLKTCPICGLETLDEAAVCPRCGHEF